jgi:hypothetical protein
MTATPLFTLSCLPPLAHLRLMQQYPEIYFDLGLHFRKQTLRNRYHILSPNGIQTLVIPTVHTGGKSQPLGEVRISYADNWPVKHWRSLEAAYRRSPFFEYFEDDLQPIYEQRYEKLADFNKAMMEWIFDTLEIPTRMLFLQQTPGPETTGETDFRFLSETGDPDKAAQQPYMQVFSAKSGFVSGLSALDALFNCGKMSV